MILHRFVLFFHLCTGVPAHTCHRTCLKRIKIAEIDRIFLRTLEQSSISNNKVTNAYFFMLDEASHKESGSKPAGSFSATTTNIPFSLYVVYIVRTIIMKKYVPTQPISICLKLINLNCPNCKYRS